MRFSSPTAFMAQKKEVVDEAFAGDIIGLPDTGNFKIGDTLTSGEELHFKGLPSFSPEMFKYIENADPMKAKQLNKGIEQLMDEVSLSCLPINSMAGRLSVRWDNCSLRLFNTACCMSMPLNVNGSRSAYIRLAGSRVITNRHWRISRNVRRNIWRWIRKAVMFI